MTWLSWADDGRKHGTGIQWTHIPGYKGETWNPTVGCTRVSPGCDHCYAFALHDQRHLANADAARAVASQPSAGSYKPAGARRAGHKLPLPPQYDVPFSKVQLLPDRLEQPLHWREPRAVFVDSMADLFHEDVPDGFIAQVWATMLHAAPQYWLAEDPVGTMSGGHIFMVLTKRAERMRDLLTSPRFVDLVNEHVAVNYDPEMLPLPHIWLGVSAERQQEADERIPLLLDTPAAVRFVSYEPALGPIDFTRIDAEPTGLEMYRVNALTGRNRDMGRPCRDVHRLDWLIVGGESGPHARPFDLEWARSAVEQGRAAGVPVFVKQTGALPWLRRTPGTESGARLRMRDRHGGDWSEWPEELRVREFPIEATS
jgi:protein gp37